MDSSPTAQGPPSSTAAIRPERPSSTCAARVGDTRPEGLAEGAASGELRPIDPDLGTWMLLGLLYPFLAPPAAEVAPEDTVTQLVDVFFHGAAR